MKLKLKLLLLLVLSLLFCTSCAATDLFTKTDDHEVEAVEEEDEDEDEEETTEEKTTEEVDLDDVEIVDNNPDSEPTNISGADPAIDEIYCDILSEAKKEAETLSKPGGDRYVSNKYDCLYSDYTGLDINCYAYSFEDLNGDGLKELMLCAENEVTSIYTVSNGEAVMVLEAWYRNGHKYMGDGMFYNVGSGGASYTLAITWQISKDGTKLEFVDGVQYLDGVCNKLISDGNGSYTEGEEITEDDYTAFMDDKESKVRHIDSNPIKDFENPYGETSSSSELDYSSVAGKTFKVYGSGFALEWSDEFTISSDGSFTGTNTYGGETTTTSDYSGSFGAIETISPLCYSFEIKVGGGYLAEGSDVTLFDKGFAVADLPTEVKQWSDISLYSEIVSGDTLPCQVIYNIEDGSVYAEKTYMAELKPELNTTTESAAIEKTPFYGIWCHGTKDEAEASSFAESVSSNTGFGAQVFVTTDWDNLNSEKYYVVTAGIYATEEAANEYLSAVQASYPDAYVKYSGNYIGN